MKQRILLQIILVALVTASCMQSFTFQKRRYRPGFYTHVTQGIDRQKNNEQTLTVSTKQLVPKQRIIPLKEPQFTLIAAAKNRDAQFNKATAGKTPWIKRVLNKNAAVLKGIKILNSDPDKSLKPDRHVVIYKKLSWIFFLLGACFTIILFMPFAGAVGIDFLVFAAFNSFVLALIFFIIRLLERRRLRKRSKQPAQENSQDVAADKIKLYKTLYRVFLILDVLFLLSSFASPLMIVFAVMGLPFILVYRKRWRKYELMSRDKTLSAEQKLKDAENEKQNRKAAKSIRKSLLFFLGGLAGVVLISLLLITGFNAQAGVFIFFLGVVFYSIFAVYSAVYAIDARVHARKVLKDNKKEKFYPAKRKARFAAIFGIVFPLILTIISAVFITALAFSGGG